MRFLSGRRCPWRSRSAGKSVARRRYALALLWTGVLRPSWLRRPLVVVLRRCQSAARLNRSISLERGRRPSDCRIDPPDSVGVPLRLVPPRARPAPA